MNTSEFILSHRTSDPRQLALQSARFPDVDMPYALCQIQGWQAARRKLPSWAACDGIVYPPHLSMEQCSSEATARYKASLAAAWTAKVGGEDVVSGGTSSHATSMTDLTGGFGVDFSFVSRQFDKATYVERNAELCSVVRANLPCLSVANADVACADAADWLSRMESQTMVFLDPARRDAHGAKTVLIADCTPNVVALLDELMGKSRFAMVKLSPMLDWHKAVADLRGMVREVHVVSVDGECKELLLILSSQVRQELEVACVDLDANGEERSSFVCRPRRPRGMADIHVPTPEEARRLPYLYEPNASIMKAGCFDELAACYGLAPISSNSHLFLSDSVAKSFPGRGFVVDRVTTMNKRELRQSFADVGKANVAVRNFPLSVAELRKRLKLKDGGETYVFATTTADDTHVLFICHRMD